MSAHPLEWDPCEHPMGSRLCGWCCAPPLRRKTDHGDGLRARVEAAEDRADLLARERDDARAEAAGLLDVVRAAIEHHVSCHRPCATWEA